MTTSVLFVCLGNICRSPLAEAVLRRQAGQAGLDLTIDSAGTGSWHVGNPPDGRAIVAARVRGMEIGDQVARPLRQSDFKEFDLILAMDAQNLREIRARQPQDSTAKVAILGGFGAGEHTGDIPDPYYNGQFNPVIDMIETCVAGLVAQLTAEQ